MADWILIFSWDISWAAISCHHQWQELHSSMDLWRRRSWAWCYANPRTCLTESYSCQSQLSAATNPNVYFKSHFSLVRYALWSDCWAWYSWSTATPSPVCNYRTESSTGSCQIQLTWGTIKLDTGFKSDLLQAIPLGHSCRGTVVLSGCWAWYSWSTAMPSPGPAVQRAAAVYPPSCSSRHGQIAIIFPLVS
jgi:hypothetical protein